MHWTRWALPLSRGFLVAIIAFNLFHLAYDRPHGWSTALLAVITAWDAAVLVFASRLCRWLVERHERKRAAANPLILNMRAVVGKIKAREFARGGLMTAAWGYNVGGLLLAEPFPKPPEEYTAVLDFEARYLLLQVMHDCRGQHHVHGDNDGPTLNDVCDRCGCTFLESLADMSARGIATVICEPTGSIQITYPPLGGR